MEMLNYFSFVYRQTPNGLTDGQIYSLWVILLLIIVAFALAIYHAYIKEEK